MIAYLVPIGGGRFAAFAEPADPAAEGEVDASVAGRWARRLTARWHDWVEEARGRQADGWWARWRDRAVIRLAESMADQRAMWSLRGQSSATLRYPASLSEAEARAGLMAALDRERRQSSRSLAGDALLFAVSGVLMLLPGPNLVAYYFGLRVVGRLLSRQGAVHAARNIDWRTEPDADLAPLVALADASSQVRDEAVAEVAERLHLPHLPAFFERASARGD